MPAFGKRNAGTTRTAFAPSAAAKKPDQPAIEPEAAAATSEPALVFTLPTSAATIRLVCLSLAVCALLWGIDWAVLSYGVDAARDIARSDRGVIVLDRLRDTLVQMGLPVWAARRTDLIPDAELPTKDADAIAQSGTLTERYPHDPRGHFFRALYFLDAHDLADAEEHLRTALSEREALEAETSPEFQQVLRIVLAVTLVGEGRDNEAKILSASDCSYAASRVDMTKGLELLQKAGVCP
jgi:hypothetical protein